MILVMDICRGGAVSEGLQKHWAELGLLPIHVVQNVAKMMILAAAWLHRHDVVHRDLKANNFLQSHTEIQHPECKVVLCDFGTACEVHPGQKLTQRVGTQALWAPELRTKDHYSEAVDVWALGAIIYYSICRRSPTSITGATTMRPIKCLVTEEVRRLTAQ